MRESTLQTIEDIVANKVHAAQVQTVKQLEASLGGISAQIVGLATDLTDVRDALSDIHDDVHPLNEESPRHDVTEVPIERVDKPSPRLIPTIVLAADSDPDLIEELLRAMGDEDSAVTPEDQQLGATLVYDHPSDGPQARRISRVKFEDRGPRSFVTAYDHDRGAWRNFRLDRILDVHVMRPAAGVVQV